MYKLFYKNFFIGIIRDINEDFPNTRGTITFELDIPDILKQYFSRILKEMIQLTKQGDNYKYQPDENEKEYQELINSQDWYLLDEENKRTSIIAPTLFPNDFIVWRYF